MNLYVTISVSQMALYVVHMYVEFQLHGKH